MIKICVLILMAVFYICYFAKMLQQKRKGIDTDQLGKDKEGESKRIELSLKVTTYLLPVLQVVSILCCGSGLPAALRTAGVVITALGVLAFVLSVMQMKDNWRAGVQKNTGTNLVTGGIYSISRNPAFLGFDLMYLGILCAFFNLVLCLATVWALVLFHLQIVKVEEVFLRETFGREYSDYSKKVCRYLGRKRL